jgi:hypothetical protein
MPAVPYSDLPAGCVFFVRKDPSTGWPTGSGARPTSRTDLMGLWVGAAPGPAIVSSGTNGLLDGVDKWLEAP